MIEGFVIDVIPSTITIRGCGVMRLPNEPNPVMGDNIGSTLWTSGALALLRKTMEAREAEVLELRKAVSALLSMNDCKIHNAICRQVAKDALERVPQ